MKKLLLSLGSLLIMSAAVFAQTSNPFTPGSGALPDYTVGTAYSETIDIDVPTTVTIDPAALGLGGLPVSIPPFDATVDTVRFTVTGLPAGLSASFDNGTGIYLGGATGVLTISGTPTNSNGSTNVAIESLTSGSGDISVPVIGSLPVSFPGQLSVPGAGNFDLPRAPQALDGGPYALQTAGGGNSILELNTATFDVIQNVPNPFKRNSIIKFSTPVPADVEFKVFDVLGKQVFANTIEAEAGVNVINLNAEDFSAGAYFFTVSNGEKSFTKRMIVSGK